MQTLEMKHVVAIYHNRVSKAADDQPLNGTELMGIALEVCADHEVDVDNFLDYIRDNTEAA